MHGIDGDFREDDPYEQAIQIAQTALIPNSRAPLGYFNYGVLGNELKLVENLLQLGRRCGFCFIGFLYLDFTHLVTKFFD